MAEFQEVMRQLGRICASNFGECDICDFRPYCPSKTFLGKYVKSDRLERLEKMVLAWAAEHREPTYPTWREYLDTLWNEHHKDYGNVPFDNWICETPIPADIAEKLDIEPKEE